LSNKQWQELFIWTSHKNGYFLSFWQIFHEVTFPTWWCSALLLIWCLQFSQWNCSWTMNQMQWFNFLASIIHRHDTPRFLLTVFYKGPGISSSITGNITQISKQNQKLL
jgi:hypothetical protein